MQDKDGRTWKPLGTNPNEQVEKDATFSLTWEGLKVAKTNETEDGKKTNAQVKIGKHYITEKGIDENGEEKEVEKEYLISATRTTAEEQIERTFSVDAEGNATILGSLDVGSLDTTNETDDNGDNTKFAWKFNVNDGMTMYAGSNDKTRQDIFKIWDAKAPEETTPKY
jgi:hypothetical protein